MEGDLDNNCTSSYILSYFYPRPHMEGDVIDRVVCAKVVDFYPRPHMEGDARCFPLKTVLSYFYPRPHMEGDAIEHIPPLEGMISTHALTWRATRAVFP